MARWNGSGGIADEEAIHVRATAEEMGVSGMVGQAVVMMFALGLLVRPGEHRFPREDHSGWRPCSRDLSCVVSSCRAGRRG